MVGGMDLKNPGVIRGSDGANVQEPTRITQLLKEIIKNVQQADVILQRACLSAKDVDQMLEVLSRIDERVHVLKRCYGALDPEETPLEVSADAAACWPPGKPAPTKEAFDAAVKANKEYNALNTNHHGYSLERHIFARAVIAKGIPIFGNPDLKGNDKQIVPCVECRRSFLFTKGSCVARCTNCHRAFYCGDDDDK